MNTFAPFAPIARAAVAAAALTIGAGGIALAQPEPPAPAPPAPGPQHEMRAAAPSYATPENGETIRGTISAITGKYTLTVRDDRGFLDNVTMHQGTIINPTGLTLQPGMQVTINGSNAGSTFDANRIDTPYTVAVVQPAYGFVPSFGLGWGWGGGPYPYGGWGPWGPRFGAGFWW